VEYDLDSGAHSTYSLHYHLILTTKYRRGVLTEELTQFIHDIICGVTDNYGVELTNLDGEDDHVSGKAGVGTSAPMGRLVLGCYVPSVPAGNVATTGVI
jgi:hypothetical protein